MNFGKEDFKMNLDGLSAFLEKVRARWHGNVNDIQILNTMLSLEIHLNSSHDYDQASIPVFWALVKIYLSLTLPSLDNPLIRLNFQDLLHLCGYSESEKCYIPQILTLVDKDRFVSDLPLDFLNYLPRFTTQIKLYFLWRFSHLLDNHDLIECIRDEIIKIREKKILDISDSLLLITKCLEKIDYSYVSYEDFASRIWTEFDVAPQLKGSSWSDDPMKVILKSIYAQVPGFVQYNPCQAGEIDVKERFKDAFCRYYPWLKLLQGHYSHEQMRALINKELIAPFTYAQGTRFSQTIDFFLWLIGFRLDKNPGNLSDYERVVGTFIDDALGNLLGQDQIENYGIILDGAHLRIIHLWSLVWLGNRMPEDHLPEFLGLFHEQVYDPRVFSILLRNLNYRAKTFYSISVLHPILNYSRAKADAAVLQLVVETYQKIVKSKDISLRCDETVHELVRDHVNQCLDHIFAGTPVSDPTTVGTYIK